MSRIKTYSELSRLETFEERFDYLSLAGTVGEATFGFDRWVNQQFYTSRQWKQVRYEVISRDNGCDLGVPGYEIGIYLLIHHMNPITIDDIHNGEDYILNPEFLITTTRKTHNAIHYGGEIKTPRVVLQREPGDTQLW
jgi:hypothetical protein